MVMIKKKRCCHCKEMYEPDVRNASRQEYCRKSECRKAGKAASQKRWLEKPENRNYFSGPCHVLRVKQWRKEHPGYWRKKSCNREIALQETLNLQAPEITTDTRDPSFNALQEIINGQPMVILGLIANMTGYALQDDIDMTMARLVQLGSDITNRSRHHEDRQTSAAP